MKISKSKQELARIISENGGWQSGKFCAQQDDGEIWFSKCQPRWNKGQGTFTMHYENHITAGYLIVNRHQTILSRDEYFHLYPEQDAKPEFCESVMRSIPEPEAKPTIEQLAADYRSLKDFADCKQQEADAAKADAEAKLAELVAAGKVLGLVLSVEVPEPEPELVITDWRDLKVGDELTALRVANVDGAEGKRCVVVKTLDNANGVFVLAKFDNGYTWWVREWQFIRRP